MKAIVPCPGRGVKRTKQSQFDALRLLRRWAPRNDMRVPGGRTSGPLAGDTVERTIVQNEANLLGAGRGLIGIDRGAGMRDKTRDSRVRADSMSSSRRLDARHERLNDRSLPWTNEPDCCRVGIV
jgi:hypothetical protein